LAGGLLGAIIFAILTVWNQDRIRRGGMETLADAVVSSMSTALTRLGAMLCVSLLAQAVTMLVCGGLLYVGQPFVDRSTAEMDYEFLFCSEPLEAVTCSSRYADVRPGPKTGCVYGQAKFQLQHTSGQEQNARFQIGPGYKITSARANGADVPFSVDSYQAMGEKMFTVTLPAEAEIELAIDYGGFPQEWNLVFTTQGSPEISDTYRGLLSPAAIAKELEYRGADIAVPAHLAAGLPLTSFGRDKKKFRAYLFRDGRPVTFRYEDRDYAVTIAEVSLFPQGYAAVLTQPEAAGRAVRHRGGHWGLDGRPDAAGQPHPQRCHLPESGAGHDPLSG